MKLHRRLAEALGFRIGIGDEDVPQHADRRAAGKLGLGLSRPAAFCQRLLEGVDVGLGERRRSQAHEVRAVFARPGGASGIGGTIPEGRMRLLQRPQGNRHVFELVVLAGIVERVGGQSGGDAIERVDEDIARLLVIDLVILELERRHAAANAHFHPPVAEVVEDANLLDQPQRRIERQEINQRAEPHALGRARHGTEIDPRHRDHVERRGVMLRHVQAIDAGLVGGLGEGEALVEQGRERTLAMLDVVEKSDFHQVLGGRAGAVSEFPARESAPCRRGNRNRSLRRPARYGRRTWPHSRGGSVAQAVSTPRGGG